MRKQLTLAAAALAVMAVTPSALADKLVLLHTNDTHSQIDPDDIDNSGGIARRKILVDSVRAANPNTLLIDAGDAVQGTLYFNLFKGEVEQKAMNALGYDLRILGNHEFDNGTENLAKVLKLSDAEFLATNYDLSQSALKDIFHKYTTRRVGNRKIGFIALNLNPKGMIAEGNYDGVKYLDAIESANAAAWWLKNVDSCDMVVAISHLGYAPSTPPGDKALAAASSNIDVIIGGHSHDLITPDAKGNLTCRVNNRDGRPVLVTQSGKSGKYIGQIDIDLDDLSTQYKVLPINKRLDTPETKPVADIIAPYRAGVDSLMQVPVAKSAIAMTRSSIPQINWASDMVFDLSRQMADGIDFAIVNKGGLRRDTPKGTITEGQIKTLMPFNNKIVIIDIKGSDLMGAFRQMAKTGGNGISKNVAVRYKKSANSTEMPTSVEVTVDGKPLDMDKTYRVATIDYLAGGGDYMETLRNHTPVTQSSDVLYNDVLKYLRKHKKQKINPDPNPRFIAE